jgi:hypothetical protein
VTWAHTVVAVGALLLVVGLLGLAIAIGQGIAAARRANGDRDDD